MWIIDEYKKKKHCKVVASIIKSIIFIGQMLPDIEAGDKKIIIIYYGWDYN